MTSLIAQSSEQSQSVTAPATKVAGFHETLPSLPPYGDAMVAQQTSAQV